MATIQILINEEDVRSFDAFINGIATRAEDVDKVRDILKEHLEPLVQSEKTFLSDHTQSGALSSSLSARSGGGRADRPGTISVFSAPTATAGMLRSTWGKHGRAQQRRWAAGLAARGRAKVFYGEILHRGHNVVKRNKEGQLYVAGKAAPVPFAQQAVDALGDVQAEAAAEAIMSFIWGKDNG